jgi:RNA recognition motif-containing protein
MPSPFSNLGPGPLQSGAVRSETTVPSEGDDELIPTAIVIKNIPFAVKKEQLVQLMTELNLPLPYAFNYHFDNGVFRGLAFANFTSAEETATVIEVLNHFELQGRKLRVEYKKMLPLQERERIEREKRERRGQLEEQHRPMAASQLQTQSSMSSLTSHIPATSPSPVSQRGQKLGKSEQAIRHFKVSFALFRFDCG